jgi:hypothetical protein
MSGLFHVVALLSISASILSTAGCSGQEFHVGDCVTATRGFKSDHMDKTECRRTTIQDKFDDKEVYQITRILDLGQRCPPSGTTEFNDHPANVTYCLTVY